MLVWIAAIVCLVGLPIAAYQAAKQLPFGKILGPIGAAAALTFWVMNLERMQKHSEIVRKELLVLVVLTAAAIVLHAVRSALDKKKKKHPDKRAAAAKPQADVQTVVKNTQESTKLQESTAPENKLQIPERQRLEMLAKLNSVVRQCLKSDSADVNTNEPVDLNLTKDQEELAMGIITDFYNYWSDLMETQNKIRIYAPDFCVYDRLSPVYVFLSPIPLHSELPDQDPMFADLETFDKDVERMQKDFQMIENCYLNLFKLLPTPENPFLDGHVPDAFFKWSNQERKDFYEELCTRGLFAIRDILDVPYSEGVNLESNYLYYRAVLDN